MQIRKILLFFVLVFSWLFAVADITIKNGIDYTVINNQSASKPQKTLHIMEFFAFTCYHCQQLEKRLEDFVGKNKNIKLEKIHAVWNDSNDIKNLAKLNATITITGLKFLYLPIFDAIMKGQNLNDETILKTFLLKNKLTEKQTTWFLQVYNSFAVDVAVGKYKQLTKMYNITGTPMIIIADKYLIAPATPQRTIEVLSQLVLEVKTKKQSKNE